ncbi:MAG TPA: hypothetical protein VEJ63_07285 [Planctomycetota bacterium]|nr:hypothetical protein [Planctomycetota bacterium]
MLDAGLCPSCAHCKQLKNDRGSVFYMCRLAESRKEFSRYPRLPVRDCGGYLKIDTQMKADKRN